MITLLIPLAQNRVRFSRASGRRFHVVDQMLLGAIRSGDANTVGQMQSIFRLPRRMIVEVLVTLLEDNAIQLQGDSVDAFELTEVAVEALRAGQQTPRTGFHLEEKSTTVVMERLTGALIHRNDIPLSSKSDLRKTGIWERAWPLPSEHEPDVADEGEVRPFIRPGRDHWLYRILDVEMAGDGSYWLPVDVDLDQGEIAGVPYGWQARLRPVLLDFAARAPRELFSSWRFWTRSEASAPAEQDGWGVDLKDSDLVLSAAQHIETLRGALAAVPAQSCIFIGSPLYHPKWLEPGVREALREAVLRGVHVDLLWGSMESGAGPGGTPLDEVRKLEDDLRAVRAPGTIRFNSRPHSCRASVLVVSTPDSAWACVSSYPWLGRHRNGLYCGVRISHPGPVAEICWSTAALLIDGGQKLMTSPYRWRTIAGRLERMLADTPQSAGDSRLKIFRGQAGVVEEIAAADCAALILTGELKEPRLTRLLDRLGMAQPEVSVRSGSVPDSTSGQIASMTGLAAELALGSTSCAIFSSPLFEDAPGGRPTSINVRIDGGPVPLWLRQRFSACAA